MIISRAPVRISLGGGGTDLSSYYSEFGGFLIAAAIDKYVFISVNRRFYESIRLSYSETEIVDSVDSIRHKIFRESLKKLDVDKQIELVSIADVPANCGLGSSSAFTVSLLNALHAYKRDFISLKDLAEEACEIEIDILEEPIGKQDQYISAFGSVTCLTFERDGDVLVEPIHMTNEKMMELENNIMLFYTGIERKASDILSSQNEKTKKRDESIVSTLHQIKEIGIETRTAFEKGDLGKFGELLDLHWRTKKKLSSKISDPFIDECYEIARKNGATGGKIKGAGGGGFFMFYCPREQSKLIEAMKKQGLPFMHFRFDFEGAKILVNMKAR
ncbi:MAG: sugar kinase [Candidatus Aminicenantes bacterium]|nr:MAG: sugar kinase [Candidatus Aminicenantes bacterium]